MVSYWCVNARATAVVTLACATWEWPWTDRLGMAATLPLTAGATRGGRARDPGPGRAAGPEHPEVERFFRDVLGRSMSFGQHQLLLRQKDFDPKGNGRSMSTAIELLREAAAAS